MVRGSIATLLVGASGTCRALGFKYATATRPGPPAISPARPFVSDHALATARNGHALAHPLPIDRCGLKKRPPPCLERPSKQHRAERPYCPLGGVRCVGTPEQPSVSPRLARVGIGECQRARDLGLPSGRNESSTGFTIIVDDDVTLGYDELSLSI